MIDLSTGTVPVNDLETGISAIKALVYDKRVLVVLDDVDDVNQLSDLVGKGEWFYEGSRIIVTTRDRELLTSYLVNYKWYEVRELDMSQALQLFSYHALRREKPTDNLLNLSKKIVHLTGGLPLALEVFGSFLFDKRRIEEWTDALHKLTKIRPRHLQDVLKISYDALDEQVKCIFLDIACLIVTMNPKREDAIDILRACGFHGEIAIADLTAKSLIKITEDTTLWMHDRSDTWMVRCECGATDDDGERMVACDICEVWQHTRCCGMEDADEVPRLFICSSCYVSLVPPKTEAALRFDCSTAFLNGDGEYGLGLGY